MRALGIGCRSVGCVRAHRSFPYACASARVSRRVCGRAPRLLYPTLGKRDVHTTSKPILLTGPGQRAVLRPLWSCLLAWSLPRPDSGCCGTKGTAATLSLSPHMGRDALIALTLRRQSRNNTSLGRTSSFVSCEEFARVILTRVPAVLLCSARSTFLAVPPYIHIRRHSHRQY